MLVSKEESEEETSKIVKINIATCVPAVVRCSGKRKTASCLLAAVACLVVIYMNIVESNTDLAGLFKSGQTFLRHQPAQVSKRMHIPEPTANLSEYQWKLLSCTGFIPSKMYPKIENLTRLREQLLMPQLNFLPHYKNPCIEQPQQAQKGRSDATSRIQCLPYFYVPGQAKCGTTDLFSVLGRHRNVTFPPIKEPWWWNRKRLGYLVTASRWQSLQQYMNIFRAPAIDIQTREMNGYHPLITGDMSAVYFSWNERWALYPGNEGLKEPKYIMPHFLRSLTPNARIIISLRNPVDRMYSHYFETAKGRGSNDVSAQIFHERAAESVRLMRDCLKERGVRECVHDVCLNQLEAMKMGLSHSMYSVFMKDWLSVFPRDQVMVIKFEEYAEQRSSVLGEIFQFLETGPISNKTLQSLNEYAVSNKRRKKYQSAGPMLPETRALLVNFYKPFNRQLVDILGDTRFLYED